MGVFLSGRKSGSKVVLRAKGNKIVALLKGSCTDSDPHLKFPRGNNLLRSYTANCMSMHELCKKHS